MITSGDSSPVLRIHLQLLPTLISSPRLSGRSSGERPHPHRKTRGGNGGAGATETPGPPLPSRRRNLRLAWRKQGVDNMAVLGCRVRLRVLREIGVITMCWQDRLFGSHLGVGGVSTSVWVCVGVCGCVCVFELLQKKKMLDPFLKTNTFVFLTCTVCGACGVVRVLWGHVNSKPHVLLSGVYYYFFKPHGLRLPSTPGVTSTAPLHLPLFSGLRLLFLCSCVGLLFA